MLTFLVLSVAVASPALEPTPVTAQPSALQTAYALNQPTAPLIGSPVSWKPAPAALLPESPMETDAASLPHPKARATRNIGAAIAAPGYALTGLGAGLIVGGAAWLASTSDCGAPDCGMGGILTMSAGLGSVALGMPFAGAGTPFWVMGHRRMKENARRDQSASVED